MDVKMADLDGFSATRRLADDSATAHIPVIVVTASAFGDTRLAAKEAGCAAYLPKPVRAEALFAALQAHVNLHFVSGDAVDERSSEVRLTDPARHAGLAERLRDAGAIGGVTDLQAIADELITGDKTDAALGQRLAQLVANFDFDAVRELAGSLAGGDRTGHAD
jgi:CheY-like chemotaxis protein